MGALDCNKLHNSDSHGILGKRTCTRKIKKNKNDANHIQKNNIKN